MFTFIALIPVIDGKNQEKTSSTGKTEESPGQVKGPEEKRWKGPWGFFHALFCSYSYKPHCHRDMEPDALCQDL